METIDNIKDGCRLLFGLPAKTFLYSKSDITNDFVNYLIDLNNQGYKLYCID